MLKLLKTKKKGSGTLVAGTGFCMLCFVFLMFFVFNFMRQQQNYETQMAADAIADGTAVYMSAERIHDYDSAVSQADRIMGLYEDVTKLRLHGVAVNEDRLSDNREIAITLFSQLGNAARSQSVYPVYTIRSAATSIHMGGVEGILAEAYNIAENDSIGYSMSSRCLNPNVDCSSFVYYSVLAEFPELAQICPYPFTTPNMGGVLRSLGFREIPYQEAAREGLQRGDIFVCPDAGGNGHTEIYLGGNMSIGAHMDYDGANGDGRGTEVCPSMFNPLSAYNMGKYRYVYRL